jgi:Ribosomal S13/S15 N-terminal domain
MGRLHSNGKGISASAIPYSRSVPTWFKSSPEQIVDNICKLAKKGATPSQIGVVLRDSHGVAQVKVVTGELGGEKWCGSLRDGSSIWHPTQTRSLRSDTVLRLMKEL